jgi:hypothetical protein
MPKPRTKPGIQRYPTAEQTKQLLYRQNKIRVATPAEARYYLDQIQGKLIPAIKMDHIT